MEQVHAEDYYRMKELLEVSDGEELTFMEGLDKSGLSRVLDIFKDMTFEEVK